MTRFCTLSLFTPCLIEPDEVSLELMDPWFYGNCCLECEKRDTGCFCSEIWCTILLHDEPHQISLRSSHLKHWSQSRRNCSIRCVFDRIKRTSIGSCHGARPALHRHREMVNSPRFRTIIRTTHSSGPVIIWVGTITPNLGSHLLFNKEKRCCHGILYIGRYYSLLRSRWYLVKYL